MMRQAGPSADEVVTSDYPIAPDGASERFHVVSPGVLGLRTNIAGFRWSFGNGTPAAAPSDFQQCRLRLRFELGPVSLSSAPHPIRDAGRKYHYFRGHPGVDALYYERPFLLNRPIRLLASGLLSEEPCLQVSPTYYRFVNHRLMNVHSPGYILTDLTALMLLRLGFASLHCSAFRLGDATVGVFAPPNTGKTLTTMMACLEHGAKFLAEDLAITDGRLIHAVAWTSTFRYYSGLDRRWSARLVNRLTRWFPPVELFSLVRSQTVNQYLPAERILEQAELTHVVILETGPADVFEPTPAEALQKLKNLNRFEFNFVKAPMLVAYEFFNPELDLDGANDRETEVLRAMVGHARKVLIVRAPDAGGFIGTILKSLGG